MPLFFALRGVLRASLISLGLATALSAAPAVDITGPVIPNHLSDFITLGSSVTLTGTSAGATNLSYVNARGGSGTIPATASWSHSLVLFPGANTVTVTASDGTSSVTDTLTVYRAELLFKNSPPVGMGTLPYRLLEAPGYDPAPTATRTYPLIVFLHGLGETGTDNAKQISAGNNTANGGLYLASVVNQNHEPAFIIFPQTLYGGFFGSAVATMEQRLLAIIDDLQRTYRIDPDRVYLVGLSMGGGATWQGIARYPDVFAAGAPMSMGLVLEKASPHFLTDMPVWAFNGGSGDNYGTGGGIAELRNAGGSAIFTDFASGGHSSGTWGEACSLPQFYRWLLDQRRGRPPTSASPALRITSPVSKNGYVTAASSLALGGTTESGPLSISALSWNNASGTSGSVVGLADWSTSTIPLVGGVNRLRVTATSPSGATRGGTTTYNETLIVNDTVAPVLTLSLPTAAATFTSASPVIQARGKVTDNLGACEVSWTNHRGGAGQAGADTDAPNSGGTDWFTRDIPLQPGDNILTFTAKDRAGNASTRTLTVTHDGPGAVYFAQDFSAGTSLSAYQSATPSRHQFDHIGSEANGGTWTINASGQLQITRTGSSAADSGAGFRRTTDIEGPPRMLAVYFDVALSGVPDVYGPLTHFYLGKADGVTDYNNSPADQNRVADLEFIGYGTNRWRIGIGGVQSATLSADGVMRRVSWFFNFTQLPQDYLAPDGTTKTVPPLRSDVWLDAMRIHSAVANQAWYTCITIPDIYFRFDLPAAFTLKLDNLSIRHFPRLSAIATWRQTHGLPVDGTDDGADLADPDGDGVVNLLEYALGTSPTSPSSELVSLPTISLGGDELLRLTFTRQRAELIYTVQGSDELLTWSPVAVNPGEVGKIVTVTDVKPASPRRYLRLQVQ